MEKTFIDAVSKVSAFRETADGYLVGEVRCARTGIQTYSRAEMGLVGDGLVNVYRPPEAVFHKDSLATFAGKPVTMGHPSVPVTKDNWKDLAVGQVGEEIARDGETVRVQIALMDAEAIEAVRSGVREISMGYTTPVEMREGLTADGTTYQAVQTGPIRINHLAVVSKARGGAELTIPIGDSKWGLSPVNHYQEKAKMQRITIDGITIEATDQSVEAIKKLQGQVKDAQTLLAKKDVELAQKDTELTQKDKEIEDAKAAIPTGPLLDSLVADRAEALKVAAVVDSTIQTSGKSTAEIKHAIVAKSLGDSVLKAKLDGKSKEYVDAFIDSNFDIIADSKKSVNQLADGLSRMGGRVAEQHTDAAKKEEEALEATVKRFERKKK